MKIGIMQPYLFPYIGYWQLLNAVNKYVIYDDVNFIKNGWINRNNILLNGQAHLITLPLEEASPNKLINEIFITSNVKIKEKLLKTIKQAYLKTPYFDEVFPLIEKTILYEERNIAKAIKFSIEEICKYLGIKTQLLLSSEIEKDNNLKAQKKIIHIIKLLDGDQYYNAIGGQSLYCADDFEKNGISLKFLKTNSIEYKQLKNVFLPNLSIIDIMMFNDKEEIIGLLNSYELI